MIKLSKYCVYLSQIVKTGHKTLKCLICFIMPLPNPTSPTLVHTNHHVYNKYFVCVHFMYSSYLCEKCHKNVFLFCHLEKKPKQNDLCSIIKGCSGVFFIWADYYFFRTGKIFHLSGKLYIVLHLAEIKYIKRVDFGSVTCMVLHQSPMWHKLGHCYWQNLNIYCLQAYLTSEKILPKWNVPVRYCWQLFLRHLFLLKKLMHYFVEEFKKWFLLQCKRRNGTHFI